MEKDPPIREYREFVRKLNRSESPDDEYAALAAYDALCAEYNLDAYPTPPVRKRRDKTATAADTGGIFLPCESGHPCPA